MHVWLPASRSMIFDWHETMFVSVNNLRVDVVSYVNGVSNVDLWWAAKPPSPANPPSVPPTPSRIHRHPTEPIDIHAGTARRGSWRTRHHNWICCHRFRTCPCVSVMPKSECFGRLGPVTGCVAPQQVLAEHARPRGLSARVLGPCSAGCPSPQIS